MSVSKKTGARFKFMSASSHEINSACLSQKKTGARFIFMSAKIRILFLIAIFFVLKTLNLPFLVGKSNFYV